jgi:cytochrome subunit of sulfide dehydrogenase
MSRRCKTPPVTMRHTHERSHPQAVVFQVAATVLDATSFNHPLLAAGVLCASAVGAHAQAQVSQIRVWAAACASCHGTNGQAQPGMATLAGRNQAELQKILLEYKAGTRPATLMHQISKGYTDEQLGQIAGYFAAQKP